MRGVIEGNVKCSVDDAARYLGYDSSHLNGDVLGQMHRLKQKCEEENAYAAVMKVLEIASNDGTEVCAIEAISDDLCELRDMLALKGAFCRSSYEAMQKLPLEVPGKSIAKHLESCSGLILLAVRLPLESEKQLRREAAISTAGGLIYDSLLSTAVEYGAECMSHLARSLAARCGLEATSRFSPGYGDLPLSFQEDLLILSDARKQLGISLNASYVMKPAKSITALIGLRSKSSSKTKVDASKPCDECILYETCSSRSKGAGCASR